MLYIKFHENRTINKKVKNRGSGRGADFIYFPGAAANLNVYWTFLITWKIHWYAFNFSTTYSLGRVNAQKKRYTLPYTLSHSLTYKLTNLQRLVKYIIKNFQRSKIEAIIELTLERQRRMSKDRKKDLMFSFHKEKGAVIYYLARFSHVKLI